MVQYYDRTLIQHAMKGLNVFFLFWQEAKRNQSYLPSFSISVGSTIQTPRFVFGMHMQVNNPDLQRSSERLVGFAWACNSARDLQGEPLGGSTMAGSVLHPFAFDGNFQH